MKSEQPGQTSHLIVHLFPEPFLKETMRSSYGAGTRARWEQFEAAAPELAAIGRAQFEQSGVALIGTLHKDGSSRISCVEPCILDGELYLGMMWQSCKALDLLHDPRLVLHNTVCTSTGDEVEFSLRGRAIEIRDPEVREPGIAPRGHRGRSHTFICSPSILRAPVWSSTGAGSSSSQSGHWASSSNDRMGSASHAALLFPGATQAALADPLVQETCQ